MRKNEAIAKQIPGNTKHETERSSAQKIRVLPATNRRASTALPTLRVFNFNCSRLNLLVTLYFVDQSFPAGSVHSV